MNECIERASLPYVAAQFVPLEQGGRWLRHHHGIAPFTPSGMAIGLHTMPFVNAGRWIVCCPWCPSAELASPESPRFFCVSCLNRAVDGLWLETRWHDPELVEAVEAALLARSDPEDRNWYLTQDVGYLIAGNHARGLVDLDAANELAAEFSGRIGPIAPVERGVIAGSIGRDHLRAQIAGDGAELVSLRAWAPLNDLVPPVPAVRALASA